MTTKQNEKEMLGLVNICLSGGKAFEFFCSLCDYKILKSNLVKDARAGEFWSQIFLDEGELLVNPTDIRAIFFNEDPSFLPRVVIKDTDGRFISR